MNRRKFVGTLGAGAAALELGLVSGAALTLEGCDVLGELQSWVPVGLAAFDGLAAIVDGPFTLVATTVDNLWAAVTNAINIYRHSTDPKVTTLDKVIATLDALAGGLAQAIAAIPISIPAAVLNAARLGLSLLISTLVSIRNKLQPAPVPAAMSAASAGVAPAKDGPDFVKKFNKIMADNGVSLRVKK